MRTNHSIDLAAEMNALVNDAVVSGEYSSVSDVLEHALSLWRERRQNVDNSQDHAGALPVKGIETAGDTRTEARRWLTEMQARKSSGEPLRQNGSGAFDKRL
jgi:Arc/MetJ-type ribon-helix-helix transcriptional regulator